MPARRSLRGSTSLSGPTAFWSIRRERRLETPDGETVWCWSWSCCCSSSGRDGQIATGVVFGCVSGEFHEGLLERRRPGRELIEGDAGGAGDDADLSGVHPCHDEGVIGPGVHVCATVAQEVVEVSGVGSGDSH